jgi:hypothetical protein
VTAARWLLFALTALAAGSCGRRAFADSARVSLVRPNAPTASAREALNRIEGELTAEGFDVAIVDSPVLSEPGSTAAGRQDGTSIASIELIVDADERAAELRVIDRLTNKTVIRRTTLETHEASQVAQVLAVRAVELLRASLVELLIRSHPPPAVAITPAVKVAAERASTWAARALEPQKHSTWGFDAGSAVLVGFGGIDPAVLGVLRARGALGRSVLLRATLAGLGTQPRVSATFGSASVSQAIGLLEVVARFWPESVVRPVASLGAGAMYVGVDGQATSAMYLGARSFGWALALDAGTGVELRLSQHFDLSFEAHAFITRPYQVTHFGEQDGARVSQPSLLGTLTIVGWL